MSEDLELHTQDLVDVMIVLEQSENPRARTLYDLAQGGYVYPLDEKELGPLRKGGVVLRHEQWASPILTDQLLFENLLNPGQIRNVIMHEIGGENSFEFNPSLGLPEKDAQAVIDLLDNIGNPHYRMPGSISRMHSPTFERLCQDKVGLPDDGILSVSQVVMDVMPADDIQDMIYSDKYTVSTLLSGAKVWFVYPLTADNAESLSAAYSAIDKNTEILAMDHVAGFQRGIAIIQQAGETLSLPPFWVATSISIHMSISCTSHVATAKVFADRIMHLEVSFMTIMGNGDTEVLQPRLITLVTELLEHLEEILANSFPHHNATKAIGEVCKMHETLQAKLRQILDHIDDQVVVRGLENKYQASWLEFLELKRKKTPACRLCRIRMQNIGGEGTPADRLRQHFLDVHCLRSMRERQKS